MKLWIKRTLYGIFGASIVLGGLAACGHRHEGFGAPMSAEDQSKIRVKVLERVSSKLDLNDDQKKRLGVLADKLQQQRAALMAKTSDPRAEVRALVASEKFDQARAQSLVAEKTAAINAGSPEVIAALADFYDSLNATQQAKVREHMQGRRGWWHRG